MYQDAKLRNTSCIPRDFLQLRNSFSSDAVLEHRSKGGTGIVSEFPKFRLSRITAARTDLFQCSKLRSSFPNVWYQDSFKHIVGPEAGIQA